MLVLPDLWHWAAVTVAVTAAVGRVAGPGRRWRGLRLPRLLARLAVLVSHSQLLPDRSWSSSQGCEEEPLAIPLLAETRSPSWPPHPAPPSCPAEPSNRYTQAAPCTAHSSNGFE